MNQGTMRALLNCYRNWLLQPPPATDKPGSTHQKCKLLLWRSSMSTCQPESLSDRRGGFRSGNSSKNTQETIRFYMVLHGFKVLLYNLF